MSKEKQSAQVQAKQQSVKSEKPTIPHDQQQAPLGQLLEAAALDPRAINPAGASLLQRSIGNRALGQLINTADLRQTGRSSSAENTLPRMQAAQAIQAKLTVNAPGDAYEQEADAVAKNVVGEIRTTQSHSSTPPSAQRQEDDELAQMMPQLIQRDSAAGPAVDEAFETNLNRQRGGGAPLPAPLRADFEPKFGADFGGVRVHTNTQSDQLNRSIQAKAFTTGQDVFFRQGAYQPDTAAGKELIAHELTHTLQQSPQPKAPGQLQRSIGNRALGQQQARVSRSGQVTDNGTQRTVPSPVDLFFRAPAVTLSKAGGKSPALMRQLQRDAAALKADDTLLLQRQTDGVVWQKSPGELIQRDTTPSSQSYSSTSGSQSYSSTSGSQSYSRSSSASASGTSQEGFAKKGAAKEAVLGVAPAAFGAYSGTQKLAAMKKDEAFKADPDYLKAEAETLQGLGFSVNLSELLASAGTFLGPVASFFLGIKDIFTAVKAFAESGKFLAAAENLGTLKPRSGKKKGDEAAKETLDSQYRFGYENRLRLAHRMVGSAARKITGAAAAITTFATAGASAVVTVPISILTAAGGIAQALKTSARAVYKWLYSTKGVKRKEAANIVFEHAQKDNPAGRGARELILALNLDSIGELEKLQGGATTRDLKNLLNSSKKDKVALAQTLMAEYATKMRATRYN